MTGRTETFTHRQMQTRTAKLAGALSRTRLRQRRPRVIYLPMVAEAAIAMLAYVLGWVRSIRWCSAVRCPAELARRASAPDDRLDAEDPKSS
jgi:acyl-coenzyme A synthetase/AMP-(fatty) acid ligase